MHQARSTVRCSASGVKGELHPAVNHLSAGLPHFVRTFLDMDDKGWGGGRSGWGWGAERKGVGGREEVETGGGGRKSYV